MQRQLSQGIVPDAVVVAERLACSSVGMSRRRCQLAEQAPRPRPAPFDCPLCFSQSASRFGRCPLRASASAAKTSWPGPTGVANERSKTPRPASSFASASRPRCPVRPILRQAVVTVGHGRPATLRTAVAGRTSPAPPPPTSGPPRPPRRRSPQQRRLLVGRQTPRLAHADASRDGLAEARRQQRGGRRWARTISFAPDRRRPDAGTVVEQTSGPAPRQLREARQHCSGVRPVASRPGRAPIHGNVLGRPLQEVGPQHAAREERTSAARRSARAAAGVCRCRPCPGSRPG